MCQYVVRDFIFIFIPTPDMTQSGKKIWETENK